MFDSLMHERVTGKLRLESDLRCAISGAIMSIVCRPLYDLSSCIIMGLGGARHESTPTAARSARKRLSRLPRRPARSKR
jgi:hypothetical protein